ncbi:MAG: hydroxyphenylacetyl-CoA thioesterase PaaI [Bacteroidota bacterium]
MSSKELASRIVDEMYNNDAFSQWLGIERLGEDAGTSKVRMTVRKEMLNGFQIAHGGITYSLADSALAFACNSQGKRAVSVETSISHTTTVREGDILTATATEQHKSNKIGVYQVEVVNQNDDVVALFKGTVYRTGKNWFE